ALLALGLRERREDGALLRLPDREDGAGGGPRGRRSRGERQVAGVDRLALAEDQRALERVLELAHVAGPRVRAQARAGGLRQARDAAGEARGDAFEER